MLLKRLSITLIVLQFKNYRTVFRYISLNRVKFLQNGLNSMKRYIQREDHPSPSYTTHTSRELYQQTSRISEIKADFSQDWNCNLPVCEICQMTFQKGSLQPHDYTSYTRRDGSPSMQRRFEPPERPLRDFVLLYRVVFLYC